MHYLEGHGWMAGNWARLRPEIDYSGSALAHCIGYVTEAYAPHRAATSLRWGSICGQIKDVSMGDAFLDHLGSLRCTLCEEMLADPFTFAGPGRGIGLSNPNPLYL